MTQFSYKFVGDTPKVFQGNLVKPGAAVASHVEIVNGDFEPANPAAKAAKAATEKANKQLEVAAAAEREAAVAYSAPFPAETAAPAAPEAAPASAPAEG